MVGDMLKSNSTLKILDITNSFEINPKIMLEALTINNSLYRLRPEYNQQIKNLLLSNISWHPENHLSFSFFFQFCVFSLLLSLKFLEKKYSTRIPRLVFYKMIVYFQRKKKKKKKKKNQKIKFQIK